MVIKKKTPKEYKNLRDIKLLFWFASLLSGVLFISLVFFHLVIHQNAVFAQSERRLPEVELTPVILGLNRPVYITHAGDGSERLFVVEQAGKILSFDKNLVKTNFLDLTDRVLSPASGGGNEQGLLSIAFPPEFPSKPYFYVYYTKLNGNNVLSRFFLSGNSGAADPTSEEPMLAFSHPQYTNHNGGQIAFGPDGYLYIGVGDGGGGGDPFNNAQNPVELKGKLLRIDVEINFLPNRIGQQAKPSYWISSCSSLAYLNDFTYAIPDDNPFVDDPDYRSEIWAIGLRNPWRFSFDRLTGDLFIGDVGQENWEEINFQTADSSGGQNFGWNIMEGNVCYNALTCGTTKLTLPVFTYPNASTENCSVTGGYVYRGKAIPALDGIYIFGDFCSGSIFGLQKHGIGWQSEPLTNTNFWISSFGEDENGEIYVADMVGGGVYRIDNP